MALSRQDLLEINTIFTETVDTCMTNISSDDNLTEVKKYLFNVVLDTVPQSLMNDGELATLVKETFSKDIIANFILSLSFSFYSKAFSNEEDIKSFCEILANSISILPDKQNDYLLMPREYITRVYKEGNIYEVLINNKWLVVFLLLRANTRLAESRKTN